MLENEGRCLGSLKNESEMRSPSIPSTAQIWPCHLIKLNQNSVLVINREAYSSQQDSTRAASSGLVSFGIGSLLF
jgi:hypothetical protein